MSLRKAAPADGFTIIELMIATMIFSVILLIALAGFVQIGRMYYRGLSAARTQEAARTIIDDVAREIQFGSSSVQTAGPNTLCIGNRRYTYALHKRVTGSPAGSREALHALQKDLPGAASSGCAAATAAELSTAEELLSDNMRLAKFSVTPVVGSNDKLWTVTVKVAFGQDDLFEGFQTLGGDPMGDSSGVKCKGATFMGGQFCAVSEVSTTVYRRLR